jgi:hypothetical protein
MALSSGTDNIIAALEQSNRVHEVSLQALADWQLENVLAAMQVPFPELIDLRLSSFAETVPVIPGSFLDRSAPRLQHFSLSGIPFPEFPKLLLSATHFRVVSLYGIPHSAYMSPEADGCARRACCCTTRLAFLLTSSSLLNFYLSLPFSLPSIVHCTMLCLTRPRTCTCTHTYCLYRLIPSLTSKVLCRLALVLEIETQTEMILHAFQPIHAA